MALIEFSGYVAPGDPQINAHSDGIKWKDANITFSFKYRIDKSRVSIECDVDAVTDFVVNYVHQIAFIQIRGLIDAIAFARGTGLRLILDYCTLPGEQPRPVRSGSDILANLCHLTAQEVVDATEKDRRLLKPLNDLAETLHNPLDSFVNAHRAIEGLCRLLSNHRDPARRWESLRENLNLSRPYLDFVTELSKGARHGETGPVQMVKVGQVQVVAWTVTVRYLEFRKRGGVRLPLSEFPLL